MHRRFGHSWLCVCSLRVACAAIRLIFDIPEETEDDSDELCDARRDFESVFPGIVEVSGFLRKFHAPNDNEKWVGRSLSQKNYYERVYGNVRADVWARFDAFNHLHSAFIKAVPKLKKSGNGEAHFEEDEINFDDLEVRFGTDENYPPFVAARAYLFPVA